jgi:pentose-5-phosphate-3-epimerase
VEGIFPKLTPEHRLIVEEHVMDNVDESKEAEDNNDESNEVEVDGDNDKDTVKDVSSETFDVFETIQASIMEETPRENTENGSVN